MKHVHFDVPEFRPTPGTEPVALDLASKKDVLRNLDVRDESGRALPVMSRKRVFIEIIRVG